MSTTAHRSTHRRTLAAPPSTDLAPKTHPKPTNSNPDPSTKPFTLKHHGLSKSLNSSQTHNFRTTQKPKEEERSEGKVISLKGFEEELKRRTKERSLVSSRGGGRRRSFGGGTHVELSDVFASNGVKVVSADMPPVMQIHAVELARKVHDSLEKFTSKTLASTLKKEFDEMYGPAWHCIVGTSFGSFVTHSVGGFLYFSMGQKLYILLFKTTVQRAD